MRRLGWAEALFVACRTCHQPQWAKCVSLETGKAKRWTHTSRQRDYIRAKEDA